MLKIDKTGKKLNSLEKITLSDSGLTERYDLQSMITNCPDIFFKEMGEELLLIGEEVKPTHVVEDRIDLLAIDKDGNAVIIELKRGNNKLHLLQALSYAAMVSDWQPDQIMEQLRSFHGSGDAEETLDNFLTEERESLNSAQRIILIAEQYDYEVLVTAEWLTNYYAVDIKCYRLQISKENEENEYLNCTCIFPPPEIAEHVIQRGRQKSIEENTPESWEEVFNSIDNQAVLDFFRQEISSGRENQLSHKDVYFRIHGKREFFIAVRRDYAYVWQYHRFEGDVDFWNEKLGNHIKIQEINGKQSLRFFLSTKEDFEAFKHTAEKELTEMSFNEASS